MLRTPASVIHALQPLPIPVTGQVQVLPVTIGHALLLDRFDSPLMRGQPLDAPAAFRAAFILTRPAAAALAALAHGPAEFDAAVAAFVTTELRDVNQALLSVLLHAQMQAATAADRPRQFPANRRSAVSDIDECRGLGYQLAMVARLVVEMPGIAAICPGGDLYNLPLATAFLLTVADDIRNGASFTDAPGYVAEERLDREAVAREARDQKSATEAATGVTDE